MYLSYINIIILIFAVACAKEKTQTKRQGGQGASASGTQQTQDATIQGTDEGSNAGNDNSSVDSDKLAEQKDDDTNNQNGDNDNKDDTVDTLPKDTDTSNTPNASAFFLDNDGNQINAIQAPAIIIAKASNVSMDLKLCIEINGLSDNTCIDDAGSPMLDRYSDLKNMEQTANGSKWAYDTVLKAWMIYYNETDSVDYSEKTAQFFYYDPESLQSVKSEKISILKASPPKATTYDANNKSTNTFTAGATGKEIVEFMDANGYACVERIGTEDGKCINADGSANAGNFIQLKNSPPLPSGENWKFNPTLNRWSINYQSTDSSAASGLGFRQYFYNSISKLLGPVHEFNVAP
ncbi:MAG: hypothetical protein R3B45_05020 [Bdellovibrionota bacterium]